MTPFFAGIARADAGRGPGADLRALAGRLPVAEPPERLEAGGAAALAAGDGLHVERWDQGWIVADLDLTNLVELAATPDGQGASDHLLRRLYERHGAAFVDRLRGAFAIAVWDGAAGRLLLAADRFGFRRLHYAPAAGALAFASRAHGALIAAGADADVDPDAVYAYLNFGAVPAPQSVYRAVHRLPPGHLASWQAGRLSVHRYWDLGYDERPTPADGAAHELFQRTEDAVRRALTGLEAKHAGAFLSGGTDSSTVVGLMGRLTGERVNAFSIGFAEARYNELAYAELAARHFDAAHYTKLVTADDAFECVADLVAAYDEPFGNSSAIPTYLCARLARQMGVHTLLAGDGGDEIFGGNERYRRERVLSRYRLLPALLRRGVIEPGLRALPAGGATLLGKAQRYVQRACLPNPERFYASEFFVARERDWLLHPDFRAAVTADWPFEVARRHYAAAPAAAELNRLLYLDVKITLGDNDLFKVTRTAEAAGLAVRFPMLDQSLVEFTATLPAWHKVRGTEKRHLFKRAFATLLPRETLAKTKHGFGLPIADWLRGHRRFRELARDTLHARAARERGYWAKGAIESLFRLHEADATPFYGDVLWTLLMLELWHQRHGARS